MPQMTRKLQRYGLELVIVFLGVSLSLAAEGWRENRADARAEEASLVRLRGDLGLDQSDMRGNAGRAETGLRAARWLIENSSGVHAPDSVSAALTSMGLCSFFVPYTSEYTALKSSGRLSLISNAPIRESIVRLYEEQPFLDWLHERDCLMTSDMMDSLVGRLEMREPVQRRGSTRYPRVVFKAGQESLLRDAAMQGQLVRMATQRQYLVDQIERRIESTEALRRLIAVELAGRGVDTTETRRRPTGDRRPGLQDSIR